MNPPLDLEFLPDTLAFPVTAAHIAAGKRSDCAACPVALALIEAYPPPKGHSWEVFLEEINLLSASLTLATWKNDFTTHDFIVFFDEKRCEVRPFMACASRVSAA